jgi:hypothetical protein
VKIAEICSMWVESRRLLPNSPRKAQTMSSTFGGVTAAQPAWAQAPQADRPSPQQVLQPVAQLLGTTSQNLLSQMQSGTTLSSIASQQGVSQANLISAIEQGLQSTSPTGATASQTGSSSNLTTVATNIANGTAKIGHHHHHHHGSGSTSSSLASLGLGDDSDADGTSTSPTSTVSSLASILGLDPNTVAQLLNSGASVSSLASGSGLPGSELQSLFSTGLQIDTTA